MLFQDRVRSKQIPGAKSVDGEGVFDISGQESNVVATSDRKSANEAQVEHHQSSKEDEIALRERQFSGELVDSTGPKVSDGRTAASSKDTSVNSKRGFIKVPFRAGLLAGAPPRAGLLNSLVNLVRVRAEFSLSNFGTVFLNYLFR